MSEHTIWLPGKPVPWTRTAGGPRRYQSPKYAAWLDEMRWLMTSQSPQQQTGPQRVEMEVTPDGIVVRLSHSEQKRPKGMRGDLDNHVKAVLDVLAPQWYEDDRQVTELEARFGMA